MGGVRPPSSEDLDAHPRTDAPSATPSIRKSLIGALNELVEVGARREPGLPPRWTTKSEAKRVGELSVARHQILARMTGRP